jgi:hypothetical protein
VFGVIFDELVVEAAPMTQSLDDLVEVLEDIKEAHGGSLVEEDHLYRVTYVAPDGTRLTFDIGADKVTLGGHNKQACAILVGHAQRFAFGLTAQSQILLRAAETRQLPAPAK